MLSIGLHRGSLAIWLVHQFFFERKLFHARDQKLGDKIFLGIGATNFGVPDFTSFSHKKCCPLAAEDFLNLQAQGQGQSWYQREAMRAVNQTLGRVIRHRTWAKKIPGAPSCDAQGMLVFDLLWGL